MSLKFSAVPFRQRRVQMYIAVARTADLDYFQVDVWNPKAAAGRTGYQRQPSDSRIRNIAKYLERNDAILPVAGLVNVRERGAIRYAKGTLTIPNGIFAHVVDMQHRMAGLVKARDEGTITSQFEFPIVVTEGLSAVDEAVQFYIINTKAKRMDIALTRRLLIENNRVHDLADVQPWEVAGVRIAIMLNESLRDNPWFGALRPPNQERLQGHVATEKSFVTSLRALVSRNTNRPKAIARRLGRLWSAIRSNVPDAFKEPRKYLLQKTLGMNAFNLFVAPRFLVKYRDEQFVGALSGLKGLKAAFWRSTNKRGAKRFGSGLTGQANLADFLKGKLGLGRAV